MIDPDEAEAMIDPDEAEAMIDPDEAEALLRQLEAVKKAGFPPPGSQDGVCQSDDVNPVDAKPGLQIISGYPVLGKGSSGPRTFRRAVRELRMFAAVQSPFLVILYDAGQDGESMYYAMEYFEMGSLAVSGTTTSRADALRAVAHAARACHALHEAGIVHRDVKPANILLHPTGAKLSDLGLAQVMQPGVLSSGLGPLGSVEFLDPAVVRGAPASRASDIWSLGATLHWSLAGKGMYGDLPDDPLKYVMKVLGSSPVLDADLAPAVADLIQACLAPLPSDRPRTAAEVADRIESW